MGARNILLYIDKFSSIESEITELKDYVKRLEFNRISAMLQNIKDDEIRLTKCVEDVEAFHTDMFVFSKTEHTSSEAKSKSSTNDDMKNAKHFETDQDSSMNRLECSVVEMDSSMNRLECSVVEMDSSMNQSESSIVEMNSSMNQPVGSVIEPDYSVNQQESSVIESNNSMNQPESFLQKLHLDLPQEMFETIYSSESESFDSDDESHDSNDKSYNIKSESDNIKDESTDDQNEMIKKALLELLTDDEREITKLVLHFIFTFNRFKRSLRAAETKLSQIRHSPNGFNDNFKIRLERLSGSVLHLDETLYNIYAKYFDMLKKI